MVDFAISADRSRAGSSSLELERMMASLKGVLLDGLDLLLLPVIFFFRLNILADCVTALKNSSSDEDDII